MASVDIAIMEHATQETRMTELAREWAEKQLLVRDAASAELRHIIGMQKREAAMKNKSNDKQHEKQHGTKKKEKHDTSALLTRYKALHEKTCNLSFKTTRNKEEYKKLSKELSSLRNECVV